jgi:Gpi18-like mannosyltransferase
LIARYLARRGHGDGMVALGGTLFFLNPLVLYNGAFYGRFDAMCVGLFLLAIGAFRPGQSRSWRFPLLYALAVAMKTYPIFIMPWLLVREPSHRRRLIPALTIVLGGLSLPYLLANARMFFADIALYDLHKAPGNLSWQVVLLGALTTEQARLLSYFLLALFELSLFAFVRLDLYTYCAVAVLLFLILSKVMIEQYLLWPLPFLIFAVIDCRSWASAALLALMTAVGLVVNPFVHPFGQQPGLINAGLALCILAYVLTRRGRVASV